MGLKRLDRNLSAPELSRVRIWEVQAEMREFRNVSLIAVLIGVTLLFAIWAGNFSDYMLLEDLGLDESEAAKALRDVSPGERIVLNGGLVFSIFGTLGILAYAIRRLIGKS